MDFEFLGCAGSDGNAKTRERRCVGPLKTLFQQVLHTFIESPSELAPQVMGPPKRACEHVWDSQNACAREYGAFQIFIHQIAQCVMEQ